MQIDFNIWVIICGAIIVLGFFASFILWIRKENKVSNRLLSLLLLCFSLWMIHTFYSVTGIFGQNPDFYFRPIYYSFAFGPLIYLYVRSITNGEFRLKPIHIIHFIPVIIQAGLYFFLFIQDYEYRNWYWQTIHFPYTYRIEFDGTFVSLAIYTVVSLFLITSYQKWVKEHFSEASKIILNWLKIILSLFLVLCFVWLIEVILRDIYTKYYDYTIMVMGLLTLILAYIGVSQTNMSHIHFEKEEKQVVKKIEVQADLLEMIKERMTLHKDYLNPSLTLSEFAGLCKIPSRKVSEQINHGLNATFHDFVNKYRVEEVKEKLTSVDRERFTLESIAYDCGFNSKATFNRIFKKYTGVSPSNYR